MSLQSFPEFSAFPLVLTSSTTQPTLPTGIRLIPRATPLCGGPSGYLSDPTPNTSRVQIVSMQCSEWSTITKAILQKDQLGTTMINSRPCWGYAKDNLLCESMCDRWSTPLLWLGVGWWTSLAILLQLVQFHRQSLPTPKNLPGSLATQPTQMPNQFINSGVTASVSAQQPCRSLYFRLPPKSPQESISLVIPAL